MSFTLVAPSTIATVMETSVIPWSTSGNFPAVPASALARRSARPGRTACAVVSPGVPDHALVVPGHFRRVVAARMLHGEECMYQGRSVAGLMPGGRVIDQFRLGSES
jgi:hypothetical protein